MITIDLSTEDLTKVRLAQAPSGRPSLASGFSKARAEE